MFREGDKEGQRVTQYAQALFLPPYFLLAPQIRPLTIPLSRAGNFGVSLKISSRKQIKSAFSMPETALLRSLLNIKMPCLKNFSPGGKPGFPPPLKQQSRIFGRGSKRESLTYKVCGASDHDFRKFSF
ncbi:hypothetical protein [Succinimonas sp.]|uniref:hypothetical protein n=1 Tax=Succinimonas sp. TaxID=1936151 RepID=UPI003868BED8